jgi:flagellar hook-length control protein FliK
VVKGNAWNAGADASGKKSGAQHQTPGMLSATAGVPDGTSRNSAGEEYPAALHGGAPADANAGQPNMTGPGSATPNLAAPNSVAQSSAAQNSGSQNAAWQNAGSQNMARMIAPPVSGPVPATPSSAPAAGTREATANEPAPVPLSTAQADAAPAGHFVSDAQLTQTTGRSEMRIALQSDNLGNIEVHARVSGDSLGANITVEKRDAHTALANELPALQQALCEKQLRVEQISLAHGPLQGTAGDSAAQQFGSQGQGAQRQAQNSSPGVGSSGAESSLPSMAYSFETAEIFDAQGRLSVLA